MQSRMEQSDPLSAVLAVLSVGQAGLVTDVDGTISPIADRPEQATVHPRVPALLGRLADRLNLVAVVSGRSVEQLLGMLKVGRAIYVGNHGLEWWEGGEPTMLPEALPYLGAMAATVEWLRSHLDLPGAVVEDKGVTAAVHYRLAPDPSGARMAILQAVSDCPSARQLLVADGRMVVDLLPPVPNDKGTAVERLVRLKGLRGVVYLGDDLTDLDGFRALRSLRESGRCSALLLAVGGHDAPRALAKEADFTILSVEEVALLLEQVADHLEGPEPGKTAQSSRFGS